MRYSVLTYIFNDYECVHEVENKDEDAEYILVTDNPTLKSDTWTIVVENRKDFTTMEKCYYVRFHPFEYVHTDYVVRMDSSIGIKSSLKPFIDKMMNGRYDRCLMIHPRRNRIDVEYSAWVKKRDYPREQAIHCMDTMLRCGYDFNYLGLFQCCFEIVRDNFTNKEINMITYSMMKELSMDGHMDRVDQTIFSFVINYSFFANLKVLPVSQSILTDSKYMQWYEHHSFEPKKHTNSIEPIMFNKPCKIWTP